MFCLRIKKKIKLHYLKAFFCFLYLFFKKKNTFLFKKIFLTVMPLGCQTGWIRIRPDVFSKPDLGPNYKNLQSFTTIGVAKKQTTKNVFLRIQNNKGCADTEAGWHLFCKQTMKTGFLTTWS